MRALIFFCALSACIAVQAQAPAASMPAAQAAPSLQRDAEPSGRRNQRVERVRIEDAGSRVDELRVGGETQTITVQPKNNLPVYQVQRDGSRVWNVLNF